MPKTPLAYPLFTRSQSDPVRHFSDEAIACPTASTPHFKVTELNEESDADDELILSIMDASLASEEESMEQEDKDDLHVSSDADDDFLLSMIDASFVSTEESSTHEAKSDFSGDETVNLSTALSTSTGNIRFSLFNTSLFTVNSEKKKDAGSETDADPWNAPSFLMQNKW